MTTAASSNTKIHNDLMLPILDLFFPRRSLSGTEGKWITTDERKNIALTPLLLEKDELAKRGMHSIDALIAAGEYDQSPLLKKAILTFKYKRISDLHDALAIWMLHALGKRFRDYTLVPVPLFWSRRFSRGFNQAELLAARMSELSDLPMLPLLTRLRSTGQQAKRNRSERLISLRNAFALATGSRPPSHVLLVDDVCTTGSTLEECAKVLRQAGVTSISAIVAAYG